MGLLDALDMVIPTGGRKSRRLIASGQRMHATVVGVRVVDRSDSPDRWEYALDVEAPTGTTRLGCRQSLSVQTRRAAVVGATVPVRFGKHEAIIDEAAWFTDAGRAAATGNTGWKAIDPPLPGVHDSRFKKHQRDLDGATAATVTVVSVDPSESEERWSMTVQIDGGETPATIKGRVPHYAASRIVPGARLPAGLTSAGKVLIDWAAVATSRTPVSFSGAIGQVAPPPPDAPASRSPAATPYEFADATDAKQFQAWLRLRVMQSSGVPAAAVQKQMTKHGIAPASWPAVDEKWTRRCESNASLAEQRHLAGA